MADALRNVRATSEWVRLRLRSADQRRLDALRTTFAGRLYRRGKAARQAGGSLDAWSQAADSLLSEAEIALRQYDFDTAWACYREARRMEIFAYDHAELVAARTALQTQASDAAEAGVGTLWRAKAIQRLLVMPDHTFASRLAALVPDAEARVTIEALLAGDSQDSRDSRDSPGKVTFEHVSAVLEDASVAWPAETARAIRLLVDERDQALRTAIYAATTLRDEEDTQEAAHLSRVRRQLMVLGVVLVATIVALLLLATMRPVPLEGPAAAAGAPLWLYVALFGAMGAGMSAFRSLSSLVTRHRVPRHLLSSVITAVRPLLGAIPALATYVLLTSGTLAAVVRPRTAGILVVAFLAGFAERWIVRAVEPARLPEVPARAELPAHTQTPEAVGG